MEPDLMSIQSKMGWWVSLNLKSNELPKFCHTTVFS